MFLKKTYPGLGKITHVFPLMACASLIIQLLSAPAAKALEVLTAQELASHCAVLNTEPESIDGQYCVRYIQGFIDGAVATDARVMLNAESALADNETFIDRAMRTRIPGPADRSRAAGLAGFCLGDPLPLRDLVDVVVADLAVQQDSTEENEPAMEAVYNSLLKNYPCKQ